MSYWLKINTVSKTYIREKTSSYLCPFRKKKSNEKRKSGEVIKAVEVEPSLETMRWEKQRAKRR